MRAEPIRTLSAISGASLLWLWGKAFRVDYNDLLHAFETVQHFESKAGSTYASLWLLLVSWSYQMQNGNRGVVYHQFLKHFDPFGCFSPHIKQIASGFDGKVLLILLVGGRDHCLLTCDMPILGRCSSYGESSTH